MSLKDAYLHLLAQDDPLPDPAAIARREERDELRRIACVRVIARADAGEEVDEVVLEDARAFVACTPVLRRALGTGEPMQAVAIDSHDGRHAELAEQEYAHDAAAECDVLAQLRLRILKEHGGKGDGWQHHWNLTHGDSIMHREASAEIERLREFLAIWIADGSLQTFEHREKFRAEAKMLLGA